jgi:voltage-gated potassium channel
MVARPMRHPLRRFRLAAVLLAVVLVYGVAGYMLVERWSFGDALYMVVITISTVGYEEVHPLSASGRVFTETLIVGGVGTMLYAFGIFAEIIGEGDIARYRRSRRMQRRVAELRDHFIVCGYGRIGTQIVTEFEDAGAKYIVIDNNPEATARLDHEGRLHLAGDAASEELLREAGIERARGLVCAVDSDERAVYIVLAARSFRPDLYILARAGQPPSIRRLELAGANRVISPYRMAGHQMAELALRPGLVEVMELLQHAGTAVGVEELLIREGSALRGKSLAAAGLTAPSLARLLAIRRRDGTLHVNPGEDLELAEGDLLVALGSQEQLDRTASLVD